MMNLLEKEIKAVIFDADNTLLATNKFVLDGIKKIVLRLNSSENLNITLPTDETIKSIQTKNLPFEDVFKELFPGEISGTNLANYILKSYRTYTSEAKYEATLGAKEAVTKLINAGIVVGIVTNRTTMLKERLVEVGFDVSHFSFMCAPAQKEFSKPHPRAFEEAVNYLSKLKIHTHETVMFGDHVDDYYSSHCLGIPFVAVLQGEQTRNDFLKAGVDERLIIGDLHEAENILKKVVEIRHYTYSLSAVSALDGRYRIFTESLRHYFSEYAFYKYRVQVETEHIIAISEFFKGEIIRPLSGEEKMLLRALYQNFSEHEAFEILQYDHLGRHGIGPLEHDTKSVEVWVAEKIQNTSLHDIVSYIHIYLTSEDTINFAQKTMIAEAINNIVVPTIYKLTDNLADLSTKFATDPVMARTHFQPASPTTFGKIFATYLSRLTDGLERLHSIQFTTKANGAVGNYNAFVATHPHLGWIGYSEELSSRFGFATALWTEQRGTQNDVIRMFQALQETNNVIRDIAQDLSFYSGLKTMYFSKVASHVGSSVMPHKINPWFAEVSEGNCKKVNSLINGLSNELDVSRLQRDLSDHDWGRSYGEIVGYFLVALEHLNIAFGLIHPDLEYADSELTTHPQVVSEAIQTILRVHGVQDAYNLLKDRTRGKNMTSDDLIVFIEELPATQIVKEQLLKVTDQKKYVGLAASLTHSAVEKYQKFRQRILSRQYLTKI